MPRIARMSSGNPASSPQLSLFDVVEPDPDTSARSFAVDPANNVVLEASAGTGKTSVLVARYVNLLKRGVDPANILAITFTRKAAAEMRERIVSELGEAAARSEFDRSRWIELRDRLGDIAISTIDAFCLSLLREFPLEADLDPGFRPGGRDRSSATHRRRARSSAAHPDAPGAHRPGHRARLCAARHRRGRARVWRRCSSGGSWPGRRSTGSSRRAGRPDRRAGLPGVRRSTARRSLGAAPGRASGAVSR